METTTSETSKMSDGMFKIDQMGNVVDITTANRDKLLELRDHYKKRYHLSRSKYMRMAYQACVKSIEGYLYDGVISGPDVFYIAYKMGLKDVPSMIKRYFVPMKTGNEIAEDAIMRNLRERNIPYEKSRLPTDESIRMMHEYVWHRPPRISDAVRVFCNDFHIPFPNEVKIGTKISPVGAIYNPINGVLTVSLAMPESPLDIWDLLFKVLFEHLCKCEKWSFGENSESAYQTQRQETELFSERSFGRLVRLGLIPPPPDGYKFADE